MNSKSKKIIQFYRLLGPGLLCAGAAIGVSHLVQSTRSGAEFGFQLLWVVIIANIIKYPFFEIAPRYTTAMGETLLDGYSRLGNNSRLSFGKISLVLVFLMTVGTMFTIQAAVSLVTSGIIANILESTFGIIVNTKLICVFLLLGCSSLLLIGRYAILDNLIKIIVILLAITTLSSLVGAFSIHSTKVFLATDLNIFDWNNKADLFLLVGLAGWMPAPLDLSIWHSLWVDEKSKTTAPSKKLSLKNVLLDFNVGYIGTALLAMAFLSLGALVLYGRGEAISPSASGFSAQLIRLYTSTLGSWAYPVIALASFATMFSTTLTCFDAFPRVLSKTTELLFHSKHPSTIPKQNKKREYSLWLGVVGIGTIILLYFFIENMKQMVALATMLSFVLAPFYAALNYLVMQDSNIPAKACLNLKQKTFCLIGIAVLSLFSTWFLILRYS